MFLKRGGANNFNPYVSTRLNELDVNKNNRQQERNFFLKACKESLFWIPMNNNIEQEN